MYSLGNNEGPLSHLFSSICLPFQALHSEVALGKFTASQMCFQACIQGSTKLLCFHLSKMVNNVNTFPFVELSLHGLDKAFLVRMHYFLKTLIC